MDSKTLKTVVDQIHRRFPEISGVQPKVQKQNREAPASQTKSAPTYLLTFHSTGRTSPGAQSKSISRWVRVVVSEGGRILKVTTSR